MKKLALEQCFGEYGVVMNVDRRSFVKSSSFSAAALLFLSRGQGIADDSFFSYNSSTSTHVIKTRVRQRLRCIKAPDATDGNVAWIEKASLEGQPTLGNAFLNSSGPDAGDRGLSLGPFVGKIGSTIQGTKDKTESCTPILQKRNFVNGKEVISPATLDWELPEEAAKVFYRAKKLKSDETTTHVHLDVSATKISMNFHYASFFYELQSVTHGEVTLNQRGFKTKNGSVKLTKAAAKGDLGMQMGGGGLTLSKDEISITSETHIKAGARFQGEGKTSTVEGYQKTTDEKGVVSWHTTGDLKASVSGQFKASWLWVWETQTQEWRISISGKKKISDTGWVVKETMGETEEEIIQKTE